MGCPLFVLRVLFVCASLSVCLVSYFQVIIPQRAVKCGRRREENQ